MPNFMIRATHTSVHIIFAEDSVVKVLSMSPSVSKLQYESLACHYRIKGIQSRHSVLFESKKY